MEGDRPNETITQPSFRSMLDRYVPAAPRRQGEQPPSPLYSSDDIFRYISPEEARHCVEAMCATPQTVVSFRSVMEDLERRLTASRSDPRVFQRLAERTAKLAATYLRDAAAMARTVAKQQ